MKKFLRWFIVILLLLLAVAGAVVLFKDSLIRRVVENRIQEATGLETHISELKLPLGTATLNVRDFRLMNPAGFGTNPLVTVPELFVRIDPDEAAAGRLHFREIRFHLDELNVVRDRRKQLNLDFLGDRLEAGLATNAPAVTNLAASGLRFGGIDKLQLTLGHLRYTDMAQPKHSRDVRFGVQNEVVTNLHTAQDVTNWVATFLFRLVMQEVYAGDANRDRPLPELILEGTASNRAPDAVKSAP